MPLSDEKYTITLDIDRDRIRTILKEAYKACKDMLESEALITQDEFVSKIDPFLDSNRVTTVVSINLPLKKHPEMRIDVNIRKKSVFARMASSKKQAVVNYYLKTL